MRRQRFARLVRGRCPSKPLAGVYLESHGDLVGIGFGVQGHGDLVSRLTMGTNVCLVFLG